MGKYYGVVVIIIKMSSKYAEYRKIHQIATPTAPISHNALLELQQLDSMIDSIKNTASLSSKQIPVSPRRWQKRTQKQQPYQKCSSVKHSSGSQTCDLTTNFDSECISLNHTNQKLPSTMKTVTLRRYQTQHYDYQDDQLMLCDQIFSKTGFDACNNDFFMQKEENKQVNKNVEVLKRFDSIRHQINNKHIDQINAQKILQQLAQLQEIVSGL